MAKEISIIRQEAQQVQNATQVGENTAQRVGGVLVDIVDKIATILGATYMGVATPTTNPSAPDGNVFYFATQAGTYTNFGSVVLNEGLNILLWNGTSWAVTNVMNIVQELGDSETAAMSQKGVTDAILNKIDLSAIDFDAQTIAKLALATIPTRYNVIRSNKSVGIMEVFSDNIGHMVTEVFDTHYIVENGALTDRHSDDKAFRYMRSYHLVAGGTSDIPVGTWGKWKQVYSSDNQKDVDALITGVNNLYANTGVDEYPTFSESTAYSAGDVVNYNGLLYRFTSDHASGAWTGSDAEDYSMKKNIENNINEVNVSVTKSSNAIYIDLNGRIDINLDNVLFVENKRYYVNGTMQDAMGYGYYLIPLVDVSGLNLKTKFVNMGDNNIPTIAFFRDYPIQNGKHISLHSINNTELIHGEGSVIIPSDANYAIIQIPIRVKGQIHPIIYTDGNSSLGTVRNELYEVHAKVDAAFGERTIDIADYSERWTIGKAADDTGNIISLNPNYAISDFVNIPLAFDKGSVYFYTDRNLHINSDLPSVVFYDKEKVFISAISANLGTYSTAEIPAEARYFRINHYKGSEEEYTRDLKLVSKENIVKNAEEVNNIKTREKNYSMLPLGVMDNYLFDAEDKGADSALYTQNAYLRDDTGLLYGVAIHNGINLHDIPGNTGCTCVIKIKKTGDANKTYQIQESSGGEVNFNENTPVGPLVRISTSVQYGEILRSDKDCIYVYTRTSYTNQAYKLRAYTNSDKNEYAKLEFEEEGSFMLLGSYPPEELNIDRRYYTRPEKLGSQIRGKKILVFGDSLSYFVQPLVLDWGATIYRISVGGARFNYETGHENTWLCNADFINKFKKANITGVDFVLFCTGVNDPNMQQTQEEDIKFVIKNKKWWDNISDETDPFETLEEEEKLKFTTSSCMYATMFSLAKLYQGVCFAIIPPYRTPGIAPGADGWDTDNYVTALMNGRFRNAWTVLREISEITGAVFIENWTRDSVASANKYHQTDGVHPPYVIAQDMASNIGHALSKYYEPIENSIAQ